MPKVPKAEWRIFVPTEEDARPLSVATKPLADLVESVTPTTRTDVYMKADADSGVKMRVRLENCSAMIGI